MRLILCGSSIAKRMCGFIGVKIEPMFDEFCTEFKEIFVKGVYELAVKHDEYS